MWFKSGVCAFATGVRTGVSGLKSGLRTLKSGVRTGLSGLRALPAPFFCGSYPTIIHANCNRVLTVFFTSASACAFLEAQRTPLRLFRTPEPLYRANR